MAANWRRVIPVRVLFAYLYGAALVLIGSGIVYGFKGLKLIEILRQVYISRQMSAIPMIGFIEIDTIGLFLTALGSATLLLTYLSRTFRRARDTDFIYIATVGVFSVYFLLNAYVCDDAFITFRTVDNFIHGYGLRWNTIERVQTFTNPLWMFLVSAPYAALYTILPIDDTTKMYHVSMIISYLVSLSAVLLIVSRIAGENRRKALIVLAALLLSSRAFVEYTSSGLENPLAYLLIALFYTRYFFDTNHMKPSYLQFYFLIASLAFVNRMDSVLLFLFPVAWLCIAGYKMHGRSFARILAIGFLPAYGWVLFSFIYYGFPFPNSYYAKLGLGSHRVVIEQGVNFLYSILISDPVSIITLIAALFAGILFRERTVLLTGAGIATSICYVISTGGDFMGGRFVSAPFLVAALLIAYCIPGETSDTIAPAYAHTRPAKGGKKNIGPSFLTRYRFYMVTFIVFLMYTIFVPLSPLKTPLQSKYLDTGTFGRRFFDLPNSLKNIYQNADYYYSSNLLFYSKSDFPFGNIKFHTVTNCANCRQLREAKVTSLIGGGGLNGFCRGPRQQLIDPQVITDPLLARLPTPDISRGFVPGHIVKAVPAGLPESYASRRNLIQDSALKEYNDKLTTVTQGKLFTKKRFQYIFELNFTRNRSYSRSYF